MKYRNYLIGGIIICMVGISGLLFSFLLSNYVINATLLIAVGLTGILRYLIASDRIFRLMVALMAVLLVLSWAAMFCFSFTEMTIEESIRTASSHLFFTT